VDLLKAGGTTPTPFTILHLGVGAFHRAHQAVYLQRLRQLGCVNWTLAGGNIRDDAEDVIAALAAAGGAYTLETVAPSGARCHERIESLTVVVPWDANLTGLTRIAALPATRIISFTVTEPGYHLDASDRLDFSAPEVATDVARVRRGRAGVTIYGALAALLRARSEADAGAITLLCCDNLRHNGDRFAAAFGEFLGAVGDDALARWVASHTACPNTMVDRITPRADAATRARIHAATGADPLTAIASEQFMQWVIEDRFRAGRPPWERAGAQLVKSVTPYEEAKIRILNGSHSCVAWAGALAGHAFIHEAVADAGLRALACDYVTDDVIPCLARITAEAGIDLAAYRDVVLARFGNPGVRDTIERVSMDSIAKFCGFVAPTLRERLAAGAPLRGVAMLPALLLRFLQCWQAGRLNLVYRDASLDADWLRQVCAHPDPVAAFCGADALFGTCAGNAELLRAVRAATRRLPTLGEPG
jgi:D-arabinitol 4-dehydrogenase